jgi:membrane protease YdiL (CAAX protease family)
LGWLLGQPALRHIDWTLRGALVGTAGAVPLIVALVLITRYSFGPFSDLEQVVRQMIMPLFRSCTLLELLLVSALAGLGEELLFRGVAQAALERASGSPWLAVVLAGALFGLAHPITPTYAVLAGLIGIYLGWLFLASGNLLVPIVTHAAYDFVALVYLLRGAQVPAAIDFAAQEHGDEWTI